MTTWTNISGGSAITESLADQAATSATNAANSAAAAATSATNSATSATASATSATASATSATASAASAASAAADLATFQGQYHGASASEPTTGLDVGDLWFDTVANAMKVYDGAAWVAAYISAAGTLTAANNLSDVSSASASRTNLGLDTMATQAATAVDIDGGTIDGTVIGGSSAAAGTFTTAVVSGTSSSDLVRITQTGAGNALVVEDSTNPDSSPFVVDASGNVGIGASSPTAKADILTTTAAPTSAIWTAENLTLKDDTAYAAGVGGGLTFEGKFNAAGAYSTFGYIRGSKTDASDGGFQGGIVYGTRNGNHVFVTNSGGLTDGTDEKMRITSGGNVGIGRTPTTNLLEVAGTIESTTGGFKFPDGSTQTKSAGHGLSAMIALGMA